MKLVFLDALTLGDIDLSIFKNILKSISPNVKASKKTNFILILLQFKFLIHYKVEI